MLSGVAKRCQREDQEVQRLLREQIQLVIKLSHHYTIGRKGAVSAATELAAHKSRSEANINTWLSGYKYFKRLCLRIK